MLINSNLASAAQSAGAYQPGKTAVEQSFTQKKRHADALLNLAIKANLITRQEGDEARDIAVSLGQHVDQVILTSSFLTQDQFSKCQRALAYIEHELCTEALAISGLNMACKKLLSFEDGLRYYGFGW